MNSKNFRCSVTSSPTSFSMCVRRVGCPSTRLSRELLNNGDLYVTLYFSSREFEERLVSVQHIADRLKDPAVLCYFTFLNYMLPKFNKLNLLFQRNTPTIHLLHESITDLYRSLLTPFCRPEYLHRTPLEMIDPCDESLYLPLHQVYLGVAVHGLFQQENIRDNINMVMDIRLRCRKFLITMCLEIRKRFRLNDKLWKLAAYLQPSKVLSAKVRVEVPSLYEFVQEVPRVYQGDVQILDDEWRSIPWHNFPDEFKSQQCNIMDFYKHLSEVKDQEGMAKFKVFATFSLQVLSLPTSNADAERLFSCLTHIKTKTRNSLHLSTIMSLILLSECVRAGGGIKYFEPTQEMIDFIRH